MEVPLNELLVERKMTRVRNPEAASSLESNTRSRNILNAQRYRVLKFPLSNYTFSKLLDIDSELCRAPIPFPVWEILVLIYSDAV
jgi:hypothetical protein